MDVETFVAQAVEAHRESLPGFAHFCPGPGVDDRPRKHHNVDPDEPRVHLLPSDDPRTSKGASPEATRPIAPSARTSAPQASPRPAAAAV